MDFIRTIVCLIVIGTVTGNPARNRTTTTTTTTTTTALPSLTPLVVTESAESSRGTKPKAALLGRCMENVTTSMDRGNAAEEFTSVLCQHYQSVIQCADQVISEFSDQDKIDNGFFGVSALLFDLDTIRNAYRGFCADLPLITGSLECITNNSGFDRCGSYVTEPLRRANLMDIVGAKYVVCRGIVNFIECAKPSWTVCGTLVADIYANFWTASLPSFCKQLTGVSSPYDVISQAQVSVL